MSRPRSLAGRRILRGNRPRFGHRRSGFGPGRLAATPITLSGLPGASVLITSLVPQFAIGQAVLDFATA
ncbi:MAG: hypothetical protein ACYC8T_34730, partial [Myxococcaceae bacterium]